MGSGSYKGIAIPISHSTWSLKEGKKSRLMFNIPPKVFNWVVCIGRWGFWSWSRIYNPVHTQSSKIILDRNVELIEVVISNLHPAITNSVIVMDSVYDERKKYTDNNMMLYWNRFQYLVVCLVTNIWDIHVSDVEKVFNKFTVIVEQRLPNWRFTLQSKYIGKDIF